MPYQLGSYKFNTQKELEAAKRDLQKISSIKKPTGTPKEVAVAYLRTIKARNIQFETNLGKDFVKLQGERIKGEAISEKGPKKASPKKGRAGSDSFSLRPAWQKVSMIFLGGVLAVLFVILGHELYGDFMSRVKVGKLQQATQAQTSDVTFDEYQTMALEASGVKVLSWDGKEILPQYKQLVLENPDFAGWLTIAGTSVDYPVMHRSDDNDFYLSHGFDGKKDVNGLLVLDKRCVVDGTDDNVLIHGHNMKSGYMFGALRDYKDYEFYRKHPTIKFNSLYQENTYDIIAVFLSSVDQTRSDFRYYDFITIYNEAEFDSYIRGIKGQCLYDIPYTAHYGDHLITLSTCDYSRRDGRLVVVGRKRFV